MKTLVALLALSMPALAQDLIVQDAEIRTARHEVQVEVRHRVAATTVTQVFESTASRIREGTYVFAVPPGAAIVEFQMWINDRVMKGELLERQKADEVYRRIVAKSIDPGILDHVRDNIWRVRVFPIPAGGQMKFLTRYVEVLPYEAGSILYTYPLTIADESARKMDTFSIDIAVESAVPVKGVFAGKMALQKKDATHFTLSADKTNAEFQKDLVVRYEVADGDLDLRLQAHRPGTETDGHFLLTVTPTVLKEGDPVLPKEVVFLLDVSRSIDEKMVKALAAAVESCLGDLSEKDRFNVIAFNSDAKRFQKSSVPATADHRRAAAAFLGKLKASGRTDLEEALESVVSEKAEATRLVFVVSDGEPTAGRLSGRQIVSSALEKVDPHTLFFGVRIGVPGPDRTLETLAERSGGETFHAPDEAALEKTLRAALRRCSRPIMTDVKVEFGGAEARDVLPAMPGRLFVDQQVLMAGRYAKPGKHLVTLSGKVAGNTVRIERELEFPEKQERWASAAYVWGSRQIAWLLGDEFLKGESTMVREAVIGLSKEHRIVTPYTALLVLENDEMYAQYGLERTAQDEPVLFMKKKRPERKRSREGENAAGLPEPSTVIRPVDKYAASGDVLPISALQWLSGQKASTGELADGSRPLGALGVRALVLLAYAEGYGFEFTDEDFRKFDPHADEMVKELRKAQGADGAIGADLFEHVLACEALSRMLQMRVHDPRIRETLQKAISWLSEKPGAFDTKKGVPNLAVPVLLRARELGLEVDTESIRAATAGLDPSKEATYVRARLAIDPLSHRDPVVVTAARKIAEHGTSDPFYAVFGTQSLREWRGTGTPEWKHWMKGVERYRKEKAENGSNLPKGWREESRPAATALRALILAASAP